MAHRNRNAAIVEREMTIRHERAIGPVEDAPGSPTLTQAGEQREVADRLPNAGQVPWGRRSARPVRNIATTDVPDNSRFTEVAMPDRRCSSIHVTVQDREPTAASPQLLTGGPPDAIGVCRDALSRSEIAAFSFRGCRVDAASARQPHPPR